MTNENIRQAKQANLPDVLQQLGVVLRKEGSSYCSAEHDSLKFFKYNGIWLYKWFSRNGEVGDAIQYLQRHQAMGFQQALQALCAAGPSYRIPPIDGINTPNKLLWTSSSWQAKARQLIHTAQNHLWLGKGCNHLAYLKHQRGLQEQSIKKHRLGSLPAKAFMPSKLLIPCYNSKGVLFRIRFRIDEPNANAGRYRNMRGSNATFSFPLGITPGQVLIIVESELDAMLIAQETQKATLALGSTATCFNQSMRQFLISKLPLLLLCLDNDASGQNKTRRLLAQLPNARNWPVPLELGKDPGEIWQHINIQQWIEAGIKHFS